MGESEPAGISGVTPYDWSRSVDHALRRVSSDLPGGSEARPGQQAMAQAVTSAIRRGRHLIVQAGTGTGKSLGYLVPAVLSGQRVVVATATKALQDQLAEKDLPALSKSLPVPFSFAVLKGRSNYLCRQRASEVTQVSAQGSLIDESDAARGGDPASGRLGDQVRELVRWSQNTASGDRAHLHFEPETRAWAAVSVGPRDCPGAFRCPAGPDCFAEQARSAAAAADIVVVNMHLYGAHLASGGAVLPPHDVVIFDEAHELEEVMTASLGVELVPGRFRALGVSARPLVRGGGAEKAIEQLLAIADRLSDHLGRRVGERVLRLESAATEDEDLVAILSLASTRLDDLTARLREDLGSRRELGAADDGRRARALSAGGHLADDLARIAGRTDDDVAWVDGDDRFFALRLSPIDVGTTLRTVLWESLTAILTSATIPPRAAERLGLDHAAVDQLDVGSTFDYRSNALLYVARSLPDRRDPKAASALLEELEELIEAAGGRTLALFTSKKALGDAVAALRPRIRYRILSQDDLPKSRLLAQFANDETSCLFATLGFWQGVDVPGDALTLVTLDRLPFPRPDDPLLEARRERAGNEAFRLVDLPRATTLLAQGAGRLIRSTADRGVVAVLDRRLATAGYREALLAALPPMRRTTERAQAVQMLRDISSGLGDSASPSARGSLNNRAGR